MTGTTDDLSLIADCRAGRSDAFGDLVRRHQDRLYPTALRLTGRAEDALDLLQDAFLQSYRKLDGFHGESSFYTWVYRIMVNLALSERRKRTPRLFRGQAGAPAADPAAPTESTDPAAGLERAEREALVQSALGRLAPDHRTVVVMKEFDGLRYEEIAEALGIPVGTVRSRLHRARSELRDLLTTAGFVDETSPAPEPARVGPAGDPSASSIYPGKARGRQSPWPSSPESP